MGLGIDNEPEAPTPAKRKPAASGVLLGVDNTANGHFRLLVALMLFFFIFGAVWTAGLDMGLLQSTTVAETSFKVSWDLILIAIGVFRGIND